jgi:hypothetical protein
MFFSRKPLDTEAHIHKPNCCCSSNPHHGALLHNLLMKKNLHTYLHCTVTYVGELHNLDKLKKKNDVRRKLMLLVYSTF